jgi:L-arabinose isomerase
MKGTSGNPDNSVTTWDGSQNHANGVVVVGSWPAFRLEIGEGVRHQVGDARAATAYFRQKLAVFGDDFRGLAMTQAVALRNALIDNGI